MIVQKRKRKMKMKESHSHVEKTNEFTNGTALPFSSFLSQSECAIKAMGQIQESTTPPAIYAHNETLINK